jgi:uncharacterized membrane protein
MSEIALARALHVASVVVWIGGVFFVTMIFLPALRRGAFGADRLSAFHAVEHRFIWVARVAALVVGATGFYIVAKLDLWSRFESGMYWWMHAMLGLWLLFMVVLFVIEPLIVRRRFELSAKADPEAAFARLQRGHELLVVLALLTVLGAVAGAHGWSPF